MGIIGRVWSLVIGLADDQGRLVSFAGDQIRPTNAVRAMSHDDQARPTNDAHAMQIVGRV